MMDEQMLLVGMGWTKALLAEEYCLSKGWKTWAGAHTQLKLKLTTIAWEYGWRRDY